MEIVLFEALPCHALLQPCGIRTLRNVCSQASWRPDGAIVPIAPQPHQHQHHVVCPHHPDSFPSIAGSTRLNSKITPKRNRTQNNRALRGQGVRGKSSIENHPGDFLFTICCVFMGIPPSPQPPVLATLEVSHACRPETEREKGESEHQKLFNDCMANSDVLRHPLRISIGDR
ncbi:hypothetical protein K432DRAFT_212430 [Lepidopterella palustris CBS 459.81]|uniref:Uncharacterized protein n=1 Tax=Lepidopterella palustris CBS 459.81 TaxID=1314670 RepID=A0A8E2JHF6_9PEZI|nr:hypothetical protein K432DRAFT_212430 [Lepidopterella palustris CBS 459.81]